ncbi:MAG: V-type ATP synthase subunit D [Chlamydiales bacterium]|nr:V-type ATP synthase subunit D [Chlamydiales bacterium]
MAEVKLTKNELRSQQLRLSQLEKYLPTLQLKKAMLQSEVNEARLEILSLEQGYDEARLIVSQASGLFSEKVGLDLSLAAKISQINKVYENIAGVDIPVFEGVSFVSFDYPLFSTPAWLDATVTDLRKMAMARAKVIVAEEKIEALNKELREVSIRVNLFEKNLIPKSQRNIKRIKVFLGDQELAAVGQAKVAKAKIVARKKKKNNDEN